ncbi:MAG TPA: hypothetical protein PKA77_00965 [Chitinophagaceae bacterium]|jgi:hypothetical protein|nr:hypothetical protein [Chitinophagaceae bacterium]HMU56945.1 hypothetical protein [Chitinophagaceae bacterium]
MKNFLLGFFVLYSLSAVSQHKNFPQSWEGNWKGTLQWYKTGETNPKPVNMELRIHRADSAGWTWQLIYGSETEDNRPYNLLPRDTAGIHWVIDERNGIVLDQFWAGNKFCGAFTVMNSTILNNYWMEKGKLHVEFFTIGAKPLATTGLGTDESPAVQSYRVGGYQKAVLTRDK